MIRFPMIRPSLSRDYFVFSVIVMIGVVLGSLWFSYSLYNSQIRDRNFRYGVESDRIATSVKESFDYISNLASYIGKQIVENGPNNLDYIASLFTSKFSLKVKEQDFFLWSIFGWIDLHNKVVVSNREGVLAIPNPVSDREYLGKAPISPWKLHLDNPDIGITSREYVIPGGMGITDKNNHYIGTVTMGLNVSRLNAVLEKSLSTDGISFVLLTHDFQFISQSSDNLLKPKKNFFKGKLNYLHSTKSEKDAGVLKTPITFGNATYHYYRYTYPYPYLVLVGENTYMSQKEFRKGVLPFIVPTIIMGFSFIVLLYFFRKKVINPMVELSNAAIEISNSNYDVEIPYSNSYESYNLAKALLRIKRSFHKEQQLQSALRQAILEADTAKELAIRANSTKSVFLSNMSHELRTPLNAIIGFSDMILSGIFGEVSGKNKEYIEDIKASGVHLLHLINDLLDINKAESGKFELREEVIKLTEVITYCLKFFHARAEQKNLTIYTTVPPDIPYLLGDALRIKQILMNLLSNAVKYTPDGGSITIKAHCNEGGLTISIQDTGIGIADVEKALSLFGTVGNSFNREGESTGLGLPLAKSLAELHQAQFVVQTEPGIGTNIQIIFPLSRILHSHTKVTKVPI